MKRQLPLIYKALFIQGTYKGNYGCPAHSSWRWLLQCEPKCTKNFNTQRGQLRKPQAHVTGEINLFFPVIDRNHYLLHATRPIHSGGRHYMKSANAPHSHNAKEVYVYACLYQNFEMLLFTQAEQSFMTERTAIELHTFNCYVSLFVCNTPQTQAQTTTNVSCQHTCNSCQRLHQ